MSSRIRTMRFIHIPALMIAALSLVGAIGCGSDKSTNPPPNPGSGSTTFTGSVSGTGVNGTLTVTVATSTPKTGAGAAIVTATGTYTPSGGSAISLTGYYESPDLAVADNPTTPTWAFGATLVNDRLQGNVAGPGPVTGSFTLVRGGSEVIVIVGRYDNSDPMGADGDFNMSISGGEVHGNAVPDGSGDAIPLDGTYTAGTGEIHIPNPKVPATELATGTYNATTGAASGTYDTGAGETGTWSGTRQQ